MTPRRIDQIHPGHYRYRRVKKGPWLPAHVTLEDGMIFVTEAADKLRVGIAENTYETMLVEAVMQGEAFNSNLLRVLWFGTPIDKAEYDHMLATLEWARKWQPDHPMLSPDKPIQLRDVKVSSIF